jgi:hypothetical protein
VPEHLFLFLQLELPWELGPPDGRYLLRDRTDGKPERVVVLDTVGAGRAGVRAGRGPLGARPRPTTPEPVEVPVTRATVIDPVPVATEQQAQAWLAEVDAEREMQAAAATVNRMLSAHRVATADPYLHAISPLQALIVRAGWGEGEQVAYGQWLHARELRRRERRRGRRASGLRPQEHLAALLAARERPLACEELALRARLDLDEGRLALAALELEHAYAAALTELAAEDRVELDARLAELGTLRAGVSQAARDALSEDPETPEPETVSHALVRLEAILRARAAGGFAHS